MCGILLIGKVCPNNGKREYARILSLEIKEKPDAFGASVELKPSLVNNHWDKGHMNFSSLNKEIKTASHGTANSYSTGGGGTLSGTGDTSVDATMVYRARIKLNSISK